MTGIKNKIANWFYTVWDSMGNRYKWHRKRISIIVEKQQIKRFPKKLDKKNLKKNIQIGNKRKKNNE